MKLPARHETMRRALYWLSRIFFPEPFRDCQPVSEVERLAAYELRKVKPHKNAEGSEYLYAQGVFKAGEIIAKRNRQANFDRHAAERWRVPAYPLRRLPG